MNPVEKSQTDIGEWIKSLIPPELWDNYCHLTYARMAEVPELAEFAGELREAEKRWYLVRKTSQSLKSPYRMTFGDRQQAHEVTLR